MGSVFADHLRRRRIVEGVDVVAATLRCAARLEELGMSAWSQTLRKAVESASTGGELVMSVRWHLGRLQRSGEKLPEDVVGLIHEIAAEIDKSGW